MIIHLDQKDWIGLAKGYYGRDREIEPVAKRVVQSSDSLDVVYPLSVIHLDETVKRLDSGSRERLAEYMVMVSKGWSILPASSIIEAEIRNACRRYLGMPLFNVQAFAIAKGISHLLGAAPQLSSKTPISSDLQKKIFDTIESPKTLLDIMKKGFGELKAKEMQEKAADAAKQFEEIRESQSQVKDSDLRHRANLAQYFISSIAPTIISFLQKMRVDPRAFGERVLTDQEQIIHFLQSMPISYCMVELSFRRDMLRDRKVSPHDLNDIMSLSIAIPYSDVVVTERMWHSMILQAKLDQLRPTRVLNSVLDLQAILPH